MSLDAKLSAHYADNPTLLAAVRPLWRLLPLAAARTLYREENTLDAMCEPGVNNDHKLALVYDLKSMFTAYGA